MITVLKYSRELRLIFTTEDELQDFVKTEKFPHGIIEVQGDSELLQALEHIKQTNREKIWQKYNVPENERKP